MTRKGFFAISVMFLMLVTSLLVTSVSAQSIFDTECPVCGGTGEITVKEMHGACDGTGILAKPDPNCNGTGKIPHDLCGGTGKITETYICPICYGEGKVGTLYVKDVNAETVTLLEEVGKANITVEGVIHNLYDQGVNATVTARIIFATHAGMEYKESVMTYFPPHEDVNVTIDVTVLFSEDIQLEDRLCDIYILSSEGDIHEKMVTCPECDGTGGETITTTDPDCDGTGMVDDPYCNGTGKIAVPDPECGGRGKVEVQVTCLRCGGSGHLTDWTRIGIVSGIVAAVAIVFAWQGIRKHNR